MSTTECAYCARDVHETAIPALGDSGGWAELASEHAADCEWVLTRAHRRDVPRCIAPIGTRSDGTEVLCGEPATAERTVEGLVCPLCAEHAAEINREQQIN